MTEQLLAEAKVEEQAAPQSLKPSRSRYLFGDRWKDPVSHMAGRIERLEEEIAELERRKEVLSRETQENEADLVSCKETLEQFRDAYATLKNAENLMVAP
jgi:chromosome segregation ATPase